MEKSLPDIFESIYQKPPEVIASAPGRINIIGEHTDYNQGYVLPVPIDLRSTVFASRRNDSYIHIWSENFKQSQHFSLDDVSPSPRGEWVNHVKGIFCVLQKEGLPLQGLDALVWTDIPLEAGLSSSAALEVSLLSAVNTIFDLRLTPLNMALFSQRAENDFVGIQCGIMDQFTAVFGQKNKALFLDCRSLQHRSVPMRLAQKKLAILVCDTQVKRELVFSDYNKRRTEAAQALHRLKKAGAKTYQDVTIKTLEEAKEDLGETFYRRARHVVSENERVIRATLALEKDDFSSLGRLLFKSHESLRDDYEASCPELDLVYELGREFSPCLGARLTGAGFGGSGIALLEVENIPLFKKMIQKEAMRRKFPRPVFYEVGIGEGERSHLLRA
jgi:galactokinase